MRRHAQLLFAALGLITGASTANAATSAVNASTVSPTLQVSVTVQKAIALTLSQGAGAGACTVTTASDYSISFGNVDALGINTPTCGSKFDPTTPGVSPSAYYTDYRITPMFTNQSSTTATVTAYVSANCATLSSVLNVVEASSAPANIGALSAMSTSAGTPTSIGTSLASGTALTRYIGVTVQPTNSGSSTVSGSDTATITYTMTVP
jgi:trimeric autotransporter adhesin